VTYESPDGSGVRIVYGSSEGTLMVVDPEGVAVTRVMELNQMKFGALATFAPDDPRIVVAGMYGEVQVGALARLVHPTARSQPCRLPLDMCANSLGTAYSSTQ
jgi:hypothetical protein